MSCGTHEFNANGVPEWTRAVRDAFVVSERSHRNAPGGRSRPARPTHFLRAKASACRMTFSRISQASMAICAPTHAMVVFMRRSGLVELGFRRVAGLTRFLVFPVQAFERPESAPPGFVRDKPAPG